MTGTRERMLAITIIKSTIMDLPMLIIRNTGITMSTPTFMIMPMDGIMQRSLYC